MTKMPQSNFFCSHVNLIFLLCLAPLIKAYTIFETTCSAPQPPTKFLFVSSPDTRGTLNILWSSLFTLFACTWTLQHPDVPEQRNDSDPGILGYIKWTKKAIGNSAMLMAIAALAPEWVIWMAVRDLHKAQRTQENMADYAFEDHVPWSLRHSYFANMGGFAIRSKKPLEASENPRNESRGGELHCLSADQVHSLRRYRLIEHLPDIREEEIKDKSKSDTLGKLIAIGQVAWTVVQIIVRAAKRLPVSPLEIAVAAFAACAVAIYGLYMKKPQRVSTPIAIYDYVGREETLDVILGRLYRERGEERRREETWEEPSGRPTAAQVATRDAERKNALERSRPAAWNLMMDRFLTHGGTQIVIGVSAAIFGGVHVIAWNFAFPTTIELIWWRCASIYSVAIPLGYAIVGGINGLNRYRISNKHPLVGKIIRITSLSLGSLFFYLYFVARLFILVEMFRTLFFLPAGCFVSTWASDIPHIG